MPLLVRTFLGLSRSASPLIRLSSINITPHSSFPSTIPNPHRHFFPSAAIMSTNSNTSTTIYANNHPSIPVHLPPHLPSLLSTLPSGPASILNHPPFQTWLNTLNHSLSLQQSQPHHPFHTHPYQLREVIINHVDLFGRDPNKKHIGFINLTATVSNDQGETLPGVVFLRGGSVAILVLLIPEGEDGQDPFVILTVQPRIPAGALSMAEIPAGMFDSTSSTFSGAAAKELEEELGMMISADKLLDLAHLAGIYSETQDGERLVDGGIYPSPGGSDESLKLFAYVHRGGTREEWEGKVGGVREEGERITLRLVRARELWRSTRDMKTLAAWALWEGLRREGKVTL